MESITGQIHLLRERELIHGLGLVDVGSDCWVLLEPVGNSLAILDEDFSTRGDPRVRKDSIRLGRLHHMLIFRP